jgi:hypothetical protein
MKCSHVIELARLTFRDKALDHSIISLVQYISRSIHLLNDVRKCIPRDGLHPGALFGSAVYDQHTDTAHRKNI